ncbi:MAG: hypothetical protein COA50_02550 [Flavobacteriaceae bacterium]|nr:MAG: hypothetical protein COA50_02550 [Flavobacteriaceae bacterium]
MDKTKNIAAYYEEQHRYKKSVSILRQLTLQTNLVETYKWNFPTYTLNNKNVLSICKFKNHFGIWFFNGVFLKDQKNVLENAQEGKTHSMRQWKFNTIADIDKVTVISYIIEAIENQKKGLAIAPKRIEKKSIEIPTLLMQALNNEIALKNNFEGLTPYKQREYCEHISTAKQEKTKASRLQKMLPMIKNGVGLHDKYRNC